MKLAVEMSLYPFLDDYRTEIAAFIEQLEQQSDIVLKTNAMSTQIAGDYDRVMAVVSDLMKQQFYRDNKSVFVCKFLNSDITDSLTRG